MRKTFYSYIVLLNASTIYPYEKYLVMGFIFFNTFSKILIRTAAIAFQSFLSYGREIVSELKRPSFSHSPI